MKIKALSLLLALTMVFSLAACKKDGEEPSDITAPSTSSGSETADKTINPLTGLEMDPSAWGKRPAAIMVNNVAAAQSVQAGLTKADIIYEAYAEGGITRFVAVFKDVKNMPRVGSIRSARYSHADLAMGHDAIYTHAGANKSKAVPHMKELGMDNFNLLSGRESNYGFRHKNGKASEHTLYTDGEKISEGYEKLGYRTTLKGEETAWQNFVSGDKEITPAGGACTSASVKMSGSYISNFKYNAQTKRYTRYNGQNVHKDYNTGEEVTFKNVLILKTTVTPFFANKAGGVVKTHLEGGEGFYVTNGAYMPIKWTKGAASNPIKITTTEGGTVDYNAGNTFVCLVNKENTVEIKAE